MNNIVTITKYYSRSCKPCDQMTRELSMVTTPYLLENFDIEDMQPDELRKIGIQAVPTIVLKSEGKTSVVVRGLIREPDITKLIKDLY